MEFWNKSSANGINDDEKAQIRSHLFDLVKESNKLLNTEIAGIITRIAMFDFPDRWPSMFTDVCHLVDSAQAMGNIVLLNNLLSILNEVAQRSSALRTCASRTASRTAVPDLIKVTGKIYLQSTQKWMHSIDLESMEVGYMALKVTGKILADGYSNCSHSDEPKNFFKNTVEHFQEFVRMYDKQPTKPVAEHIHKLGKMYIDIVERQLVPFLMMPDTLQLIQSYLSIIKSKAGMIQQVDSADKDVDIVELWEKIIIQGLTLLSKMVKSFCLNHKPIFDSDKSIFGRGIQKSYDDTNPIIQLLEKSLFTPEIINSIVDILLTSYFKITPRDLENWRSNPEEWKTYGFGDFWRPHQVRPRAEELFTNLLANFKDIFGPSLLKFMEKAGQSDDLLVRDVAYNAFAIATASRFQTINFDENIKFDEMLVQTLVPQGFQTDSNLCNVIRGRIAIIILECVSAKCSNKTRIEIYKLLDHFLNPTDPLNDKVVKVYACKALNFTIDEWNTRISDFLPYLPRIFKRMFELLTKDLTLIKSKTIVLQALCAIIDRVKRSIAPYTDLIMQALSSLWDEAGDDCQMKSVILCTLANLI